MEQAVLVDYVRWIVFLPLLGAFVNGVPGAAIQRAAGKRAITFIACLPVAVAFLLSVRAFLQLLSLAPEHRLLLDPLWTWISVGGLSVNVAFQVDPLSAVMILVVTGVGGIIHIYSVGYMHDDESYWRYFAFLNLFTFAMLTLVLADNLLLMFVGWEGVGLCSYALIGFWYSDLNNASAGSKAFIVNRIGDFGFMLGLFLLFWTLSGLGHPTLNFRELQANAHLLSGHTIGGIAVVTLVTLLFFIGATGKSAQIPLYVWLPDAMAGPTPVSALIHAATMVTAGVYMIGRLHFLYSMAPATLHVVAWIGALTALFAASIGLVQNDIKRVLAYSTVSQLGYMFLAMGVGAYAAGIFHLMTHAFFKACLFLGSGSVIHAMGGEQDMRKMGGLKRWMPTTYWTFLISTLAIAGVPGTAGFFSKDGILWSAFSSEHGSPVLWAIGFVGAGMTSFYMFRQVYMTFHGECRADHHTQEHLHESASVMTVPLVILAALALIGGYVGVPHSLGGVHHFEQFLTPVFGGGHEAAEAHAAVDPMEHVLMLSSVAIVVVGWLVARAMYSTKTLSAESFAAVAGGTIYRLLYNKYYVDEIYAATVLAFTLLLSRASAAFDHYVIDFLVDGTATVTRTVSWLNGLFDNYVIDGMVNGLAALTIGVGGRFRRLQTGSINGYLYVIAVATAVILLARVM
jgi:NADH-quinone oxidoreductase subunit L